MHRLVRSFLGSHGAQEGHTSLAADDYSRAAILHPGFAEVEQVSKFPAVSEERGEDQPLVSRRDLSNRLEFHHSFSLDDPRPNLVLPHLRDAVAP